MLLRIDCIFSFISKIIKFSICSIVCIVNKFLQKLSIFLPYMLYINEFDIFLFPIKFKYSFSISSKKSSFMHDKINVGIIIFDEFIKHLGFERYLDNEFNCFLGAIDAVCRYKNEVKVYCLSNAVSLYNPYFLEIGFLYRPWFFEAWGLI